MGNPSLLIVNIIVSLIPAAFIFLAWITRSTSGLLLSRRRRILFAVWIGHQPLGWCLATIALVDPLPLKALPDGGFSDVYENLAFEGAACAAVLTVVLALFGQGLSRILLAVSGALLFALDCVALLSNGV